MFLNILISILVGFFIGYIVGSKKGKKEGFKKAEAKMPLLIYKKSLSKGYCQICNEKKLFECRNLKKNIEF